MQIHKFEIQGYQKILAYTVRCSINNTSYTLCSMNKAHGFAQRLSLILDRHGDKQ